MSSQPDTFINDLRQTIFDGSFSPLTREYPILVFIEKYRDKVDSLDLSGPYSAYYAPGAVFHNCDGKVYNGGSAIWTWMCELFGSRFRGLRHDINVIRVVDPTPKELAQVGLGGAEGAHAKWVQLETDTKFWLRDNGEGEGDLVVEKRMLTFLVGRSSTEGLGSEVGGQMPVGTNGFWILGAKAWWDSRELVGKLGAGQHRTGSSAGI